MAKRRRRQPESRGEDSRSPERRPLPVATLSMFLVLVGAWAYATSFAGVLVLDDVRAIARNPTIRTLSPMTMPLSPPTGTTVAGRPIANLTFAINYALAPRDARDVFAPDGPGSPPGTAERFLRNVWGYHLMNLVVHLAAALVLFGIVRRTLLSDPLRARFESESVWLAGAVALVWMVHPLQTAAVTYLVQRVESLMGLCYLLTLYCAIRAAEDARRNGWWAAGAVVSCATGMATKEVMITAPFVVWLWDWVFGRRSLARTRWLLIASLAATWLIFGALVLHEHRAPSISFGEGVAWRYLITQAEVVAHYLRLAIVGSPLVFLYSWPLAESLSDVAPQAVLMTGLLACTVVAVRRRLAVGFAGAWFFIILSPTSSVVPIVTEVAAEHRMYLPLASVVALGVVATFLVGRAVLARSGLEPRVQVVVGPVVAALLVAVLAGGYGLATRARNRDYWSDRALWGDTVAKDPDNSRARVAYAEALTRARLLPEAEAQLRTAVALSSADPVALVRLGSVLAAQNRLDEAIEHFKVAAAVRPDDVDAHRFLGEAYSTRGQDALAVVHFQRALALRGDDTELLARLAALLVSTDDVMVRDPARAVDLAERAAQLTSRRSARTLEVLSAALAATGRFAEALVTLREAGAVARAEGNTALAAEIESSLRAYEALR